MHDDGPRTAPLTNPHSESLFDPKPTPAHTPERKREQACFPSKRIFNLSMDDAYSLFSSSNTSRELNVKAN
jgi:hypothetical protein